MSSTRAPYSAVVASQTVSVGMPVRNGEAFVASALGSLLNQAHENLEVIISDNCSTDRTEQICRDIARSDRRVSYSRCERPISFASNWDRAFHLTGGSLFMWAADDDLWAPQFIGVLRNRLLADTSASFALARYETINSDGVAVADDPCRFEDFASRNLYRRLLAFLVSDFGGKGNAIHGLIRREALTATGGFRSWYVRPRIAADWVGIFRLLCTGPCTYEDHALFFKRWHVRQPVQIAVLKHLSVQREILCANHTYSKLLQKAIEGQLNLSSLQKRDLIRVVQWKSREADISHILAIWYGITRRLGISSGNNSIQS